MSIATESQKPMELLGSHAGVNVIDPSTILTRMWYFDGRFLRASGFQMDQNYVRSLVALSNQAVGHGVVSGFTPTLSGGDIIKIGKFDVIFSEGAGIVVQIAKGVSLIRFGEQSGIIIREVHFKAKPCFVGTIRDDDVRSRE